MNKAELVQAVANSVEISKADAAKAVDAVISSITSALTQDDQVTLIGFGTFSVRERSARTGRNPRTGKPIDIKSAKVPVFKPGKALKEAVN
jgi:DNA-binding protein HU-beta